ncbi:MULTISPECIES: 16S rRNA (uracil(1498)-N(3))-methyltransferase [Clavibacter]|uniref:Ribosomal RNA small subunit methyltransferase E n=2 Tax=Clavibacter TaxID=1573 RepID=A0A399NXP3_9MICO|nr:MULTISPECIES: 16S rRNA (uracil(1498)-N(3))-methyltransferase [Clavibacter]KDP90236.1 16S rRNA methyltransferase [Clavibacter cf. michiganensis LMG 26808]RII98627.1 16S rRNA (uracil(1498)-N(3))-methyltransferase [Clavibacter michiganensis]UKF23705.1 16S rRNA (uracil(1498)-N(3))-methyltransferase [Clavibacter sp. A6099]
MAHFYLADDIGASDLTVGRLLVLAGQEARHAVTVSRVRSGEGILVGDGRGTIASGTVTSAEPQRLELRVDAVEAHPEPSPRVVLVQALAKGDRDELAVQAATELGVDAVIPWQAQRSVSRWEGQKVAKGRDRWRAIVREAVKQSIRPRVPEVEALATTKDLVRMAGTTRVLVLDPTADARLSRLDLATVGGDGATDVLLVVGPEGGIAPAEVEALRQAGAIPVALGSGILRTSTAGPAALALVNAALGRW